MDAQRQLTRVRGGQAFQCVMFAAAVDNDMLRVTTETFLGCTRITESSLVNVSSGQKPQGYDATECPRTTFKLSGPSRTLQMFPWMSKWTHTVPNISVFAR
jgi:hypothetical protein